MSRIVILCESIVGHLASIGSPIGKLLRPPLTSDQLKLLEGDLPLVLPLSCLEMYTWHNGTELLQGSTFFPWWVFDQIGESIQRYRTLLTAGQSSWNVDWFPLFSASDISAIGIQCGKCQESDGSIYCFDYLGESRKEFDSLESMLETILVACKEGGIFWNVKEAELDIDEKAFARVAARLNPDCPKWRSMET